MNQDSSTVRLTTWLREEIRGSRPGDRLPSTRALVDARRVSPVTVSRVLAALGAEGLVVAGPARDVRRAAAAAQPPADYPGRRSRSVTGRWTPRACRRSPTRPTRTA